MVAAGSSFGEMALHFVEKYDMMAVRIPSKFDLRRFCRCARLADMLYAPGVLLTEQSACHAAAAAERVQHATVNAVTISQL